MSSATTTAIPLTNISQQQTANNATLLGVNSNAPAAFTRPAAPSSQQIITTNPAGTSAAASVPSNQNLTVTNAGNAPLLPRYANRPPTWSEKFANSLSLANGLGTMALIAAFIFGIGAWVGMKVQISQGGKSMELAIWTTCADHQAIQNSTLCQSLMAKDFSGEFGKREVTAESKEVTVVIKRDVSDVDDPSNPKQEQTTTITESRFSKLVSSLSPYERSLIENKDVDFNGNRYYGNHYYQGEPALRATILPLVHLLIYPLRWIFEFIESILLLTVFCIHKVLSWMTSIFIFLVQAAIYNWVEQLLKGLLAGLDAAIYGSLPSWAPWLLTSNIASWLGLSALRSFWYGSNFLESVKWIFIFRLGMWAIVEIAKGGYAAWGSWNAVLEERRRMQNQRRGPMDGEINPTWMFDTHAR